MSPGHSHSVRPETMRAWHIIHILTYSAVRASVSPVYSFHGLVYTNGSEPQITSNISDSEVVKNLTDILHSFSLDISGDLETSGKHNFENCIIFTSGDIRLDPTCLGGVPQ